jgi:hypothetical protein
MSGRDRKRAPRAGGSRRAWRGLSVTGPTSAVCLVAALAFGACGGTSPGPSAIAAGRDPVTSGVPTKRPFPHTGGSSHNDDNPTAGNAISRPGASRLPGGPCALVGAARASAILGAPVRSPVEAPLGPTCIYQAVGSSSFVTVAIDAAPLDRLERALRGRISFTVGRVQLYCGDVGEPTTYAPLGGGRVLAVAAPCSIGRRFAAAAMQRAGDREP